MRNPASFSFPLFLILSSSLLQVTETFSPCVDVIAGGGVTLSQEQARFSSLSAVATAFPFTSVAAKPNSSDVYVAGRGSIYLRLGFSGDVTQVVGTATSALSAVMSRDLGVTGLPGPQTSLCGSENCIYGLSFSPRDGTLYFVSDKYIRSLSNDGIVRVFAGTGVVNNGSSPYGDGGSATSATFNQISSTAVHKTGDVFVSDYGSFTIRRISHTSGIINLFAGTTGVFDDTGDGGQATSAKFKVPLSLAFSPDGSSLFIADAYAHRVRRIDMTTTIISNFAGTGSPPLSTTSFLGDKGLATLSPLSFPIALAVDPVANVLFIADTDTNSIQRVSLSNGIIDRVAGDGRNTPSSCGGRGACPAKTMSIPSPVSISVDRDGQLFILKKDSIVLSIVSFMPRTSTASGMLIVFDPVQGISVSSVINDPLLARLQGPGFIEELSDGSILFVEYSGQRLRRLKTDGSLLLLAGKSTNASSVSSDFIDGTNLFDLVLRRPSGIVALPQGNAFGRTWSPLSFALADEGGNIVYGVDGAMPSSPVFRLVGAANRSSDNSGDGGLALNARLKEPRGLLIDVIDGSLLIADSGNNRIRKVTTGSSPIISTIAGDSSTPIANDGDNLPATSAPLYVLYSFCQDNVGNTYIPDMGSNVLRRIDRASGVISTAVGRSTSPQGGGGGDGGLPSAASLQIPLSCARDSDGGILIVDAGNGKIRKINAGMTTINTIVGGGDSSSPGVRPTDLKLDFSTDVRRSISGDLIITDFGAGVIRRVLFGSRATPCPIGFSCVCIIARPCLNSSTFCPTGSTEPITVSAGYRAVAASQISSKMKISVYVRQEPCPIGYYCPGSSEPIACQTGSYGSASSEISLSACRLCPPGTYLGASGGAAVFPDPSTSSLAILPCLPCPPGTFADKPGSVHCLPCQQGTFSPQKGADSVKKCLPCGSTEKGSRMITIFGSACIRSNSPSSSSDVIQAADLRLQVQRPIDVNSISGNLSGTIAFLRILYIGAALAFISLVIVLLAAFLPIMSENSRFVKVLVPVLNTVDVVSDPHTTVMQKLAVVGLSTRHITSTRSRGGRMTLTKKVQGKDKDMEIDKPDSGNENMRRVIVMEEEEVAEAEGQQYTMQQLQYTNPHVEHVIAHDNTSSSSSSSPLPSSSSSSPLLNQYSRLGVTLSSLTLGLLGCIFVANAILFANRNVVVTSSLQRSDPSDIADYFAAYPAFALKKETLTPTNPSTLSLNETTTTSLADALGGLISGLLVNVKASGSRCSALENMAFDLDEGTFTHSVNHNIETGEASHSFQCLNCQVHDLSTLRFDLNSACEASAVITVSAVGAWGSISATSQAVGGQALGGKVSVSVPVTFEVISDSTDSDFSDQVTDGLVAYGNSARGLSVGAAYDFSQSPPVSTPQTLMTTQGIDYIETPLENKTVTFLVNLPNQPTYLLAFLSKRTLWPDFISNLVGLAGFIPIGGVLFVILDSAASLFTCSRRIAPN
jgi:hypothetical protein